MTMSFNLKRVLVSLPLVFCAIALMYFAVRAQQIYRIQRELTTVQAEIMELGKQRDSQDLALASRMDALESALFGDVIAKLEKAQPPSNRIELWQQNRDKE